MKPKTLSREDIVALCLRQCALVIDPRNGYLKSLADQFEWHETTLSTWIKNGRIPFKAARRLQRVFGSKLVNIPLVTGEE